MTTETTASETTGLALLEQRLEAKSMSGGGGVGFDPMTIITIILSLLGSCPKPTAASLRRRPLNVARVRAEFRKQGMTWAEARAQAERLFDVADDATDEELEGLIKDCCR